MALAAAVCLALGFAAGWIAHEVRAGTASDLEVVEPSTTAAAPTPTPPRSVTVPDLVGLTVTQARHLLGSIQLIPVLDRHDAPKGRIVGQDPLGGGQVGRRSTVHLRVRGGPPLVLRNGAAEFAVPNDWLVLPSDGLEGPVVQVVTGPGANAELAGQPPSVVLRVYPGIGSLSALEARLTEDDREDARTRPAQVVGAVAASRMQGPPVTEVPPGAEITPGRPDHLVAVGDDGAGYVLTVLVPNEPPHARIGRRILSSFRLES